MIISPSIHLYNRSLGLNNLKCVKRKKFIFYHNNRKYSSSKVAILPILLWYSDNILERAFFHAVELVKSLCSIKNSMILYTILTIDIDISHLFNGINFITNQNCTKYKLCNYFLNLDFTYKLYDIGDKYKCSLLYGCIKQNIFPLNFTKKSILTPYNECIFSGRYAAAVNLYPALPFLLKVFDYFDYIIKYDIDNKVSNISLDFNLVDVIENKYNLVGCNLVNDNKILSTNVFKMIFMYLSYLSNKCNQSIFGRGFSQNMIENENVVLHGRLTIIWLGFYSSPEVRDFVNYYLSYKEGIYKYRWGDQQFYLNALLLFSDKGKLGYSKSKLCKMHDIKMF